MVAVYGRMLNRPAVLYKEDRHAQEAKGGWNLRGVKFRDPVPKTKKKLLVNWGCLRLNGLKNTAYEDVIQKLEENFKVYGIEMILPFEGFATPDGRPGYFVDSKRCSRTVESLIEEMCQKGEMDILLIILPSKDTALYNRIKRFCDLTQGIHTVCAVEKELFKKDGTYLGNLALKFNLKLGGTNHKLQDIEMGIISKGRTMVVGIDVVHQSPGSGKASIASMVASIDKKLAQWPVDLQVQVREGQEMLDKIGVMLHSRLMLWREHNNEYPQNILVYRDGVSESQYQQVLEEELEEMQKVSRELYTKAEESWPRYTLIIVGKRHHTRFFPPENHRHSDSYGNPKRGLVVDRNITEARNWDFFLQSHDAVKGTARPAHYVVLWDEIFTSMELGSIHEAIEPRVTAADRLERLSHSLCYMFSRAAKAVSIPAPVYYADIACARAGRYLVEMPSGTDSVTSDGTAMTPEQRDKLRGELQEKITVHDELKDSMFYI